MTTLHSQQNGQSQLEELLELIEDLDDSIATEQERGEIAAEIQSSGISSASRAKLADMFEKQEKLIQQEVKDQDVLIEQARKGIEQAGILSDDAQKEVEKIVSEESDIIDSASADFKSEVHGIEKFIQEAEEGDANKNENLEIEKIKRDLSTGNKSAA